MFSLKLIRNDPERLRQPSEPISLKEGQQLGHEILRWLLQYNRDCESRFNRLKRVQGYRAPVKAVGVAAPQLGVFKRVFVTLLHGRHLVFINPVVVLASAIEIEHEEGCISFPGVLVKVRRPVTVTIKCDNWAHPAVFGSAEDPWPASVVLHELGHLDGVLIIREKNDDSGLSAARKQ